MILKLKEMLERHEGMRLKPYRCTEGRLTIGVGRNIQDRGITRLEAYFLLNNDIKECLADLAEIPEFCGLCEARQAALINMRFNLGAEGIRKFKNMWAAIGAGDFAKASDEMMMSRWARQVGKRAIELSDMMETGEWQS